ncbi:hypothetical protein [Flavobacterium sp.]|uniref:hypothetical protein n=1 Tax=Flavobacterium sp. TaxID=239 RepID=UPI001AC54E22|nr:hypothetical protein [Flavobacterium sp.]MBN9286248.1 hypothetical protein [Flavobacterium sp.]
MFIIEILKRTNGIRLKNYKEPSSFFLDFFRKIDQDKIATLYLKIGEKKMQLDFGYDLLSLYDFFPNCLEYLNTNSFEKSKTLLLFERGSDKIVFTKIDDNSLVELQLESNGNTYTEVVDINYLNTVFFDLTNRVIDIYNLFLNSSKNFEHIQKWESDIKKWLPNAT